MKNKAVLIKSLVMLVLVMFVCADMVIVSDAERRDYWAYIGIRLLFIILLGWAFFVKKLQWLAWGLVVACGFGVRYVDGIVPSVKIEIIKDICVDMNWEYDEK
ncbi:MAG: hypothetical protein J6B00_03385, partial [Alphaproteobacteria bacterium]|nr:hypothetical protein [Alphaproteobacteria bacterium]